MRFLLEYEDYDPREEYLSDTRRHLHLDSIRKSDIYQKILDLGFIEEHSYQQSLNNTLKFFRPEQDSLEPGEEKIFYTIHPTGIVRRYNPKIDDVVPEGFGNEIKKFPGPFTKTSDYIKALNYLYYYLRRKEMRGNFR
ncbi:hypothetical protein EBS02_00915 [bacterium]|jgi:hypothetical protein|nr:hypothetical protein [bacterium]